MKNSSCFDDADVEAVSEALKVPSTKLEELIARNNRHRLIDDRVSALRDRINRRRSCLREYEGKGLNISDFPTLHKYLCNRQFKLKEMLDRVETYVDTGVAPILADASLYGVSVEKT